MDFKRIIMKIILVICFAILTGCQRSPDFEILRSEILDLHKNLIEAHWNKDIEFFVRDISDDFISVGNGEIRKPTKEELQSSFTSYLNNTTFTEYKDLQEPIIGFSEDGSLAWSIVKVKVAGKHKMDDNAEREFDVTYAWITLYERYGNKWKRIAEVSNSN